MQNEVEEEDDGFGVPGGKKKPKAPKKVEKSVRVNRKIPIFQSNFSFKISMHRWKILVATKTKF